MTEAAVNKLRNHFGGQLDRDSCEAILAVCEGDVRRAIEFLTATGAGGYDVNTLSRQQESGLPADYPRITANRAATTEGTASRSGPVGMRRLFLDPEASLREHHTAQTESRPEYCATLMLLMHQGVEVVRAARPRVLAAAWARRDYELADELLSREEIFALPHVLSALIMLDAPRRVRQLNKRLAKVRNDGGKVGLIRAKINDLTREEHVGTLSGALAKRVRHWVASIPPDKLAYYALVMPKEPWKELADMIHLNPATDFQGQPREGGGGAFLNVMFGAEPANGTMLAACRTLHERNVAEVCTRYEVPYSFIRTQVRPLPDAAKPRIARYMSLEHLLWYHEELACPEVDAVLLARLRAGERPRFGYGKLMERLLYLRGIGATAFADQLLPIAEERLRGIQLALEPPVVCAGDASYSMDVAIRCATVIGSVLSCVTSAELLFFNDGVVRPPVVPRTVAQVLRVTDSVRADGLTAPAALLWPLLEQRKPVKFLVVVTDEIENVKSRGEYFPTLFARYRRDVCADCTPVMVSFLENPSVKGRMVAALESLGIAPIQFRLDGTRPDLTKLDALLGLLASESSHFPDMVAVLAGCGSLRAILDRLKEPIIPREKDERGEISEPPEPAEQPQSERGSGVGGAVLPDGGGGCVVCMERAATVALLECGHLCACEQCSGALRNCPVCRAPVARLVRIFRPT